MDRTPDKRRVARIPIACPVVVREKSAVWHADTEDIGARGCRLSLPRSLTPGALIRLRFERGGGEQPLEVPGQVAWARKGVRKGAPPSAGVAFVNLPRDPSGRPVRNWIDALVAADLRRVLECWLTAGAALSRLSGVVLQLGIPPNESLDRNEGAVIRLARQGMPLSAAGGSAEGLAAVTRLLDRGVVSVCRRNPDPEGWKRALALLADLESPGRAGSSAKAPLVIIPPLPEAVWRENAIDHLVQDYLRTA